MFNIGDKIYKDKGDYTFEGEIMAVVFKKSGVRRYVVEDDRGLLLIMSENQFSGILERHGEVS